jgi:hypothetical protein
MWAESVQGEKKVKMNRLDLLSKGTSKFAIVVCMSPSNWIKSDSRRRHEDRPQRFNSRELDAP